MKLSETKIAVIGLGYVGLPLAIEFGKTLETVGYDMNATRIEQLSQGNDITLEASQDEILEAKHISFTCQAADIANCNVYIVTVPTPIDSNKKPDLGALISASTLIGQNLKKGDVVIYESTVYPGATEEDCVPILEQESNLKFNTDFYVGYSPERINPGDKNHRLPNIKKVTSGSTPEAAEFVDSLYAQIITAGTHLAPSIKVAEAAKVIENTQRDVNIALMNELSLIFQRLDINTQDVLEAAKTKWNFLPFTPGLVGGHCIGVDPYYLTHKAQSVGYHPEVVLAGRRINDGMGKHVATELMRKMIKSNLLEKNSKILVMGLAFKENCPDIRNTRVTDILDELQSYGVEVDVYDPWVSPSEAKSEFDIELITPENDQYSAIVIAVQHKEFVDLGIEEIRKFGKDGSIIFDIKSAFPPALTDLHL